MTTTPRTDGASESDSGLWQLVRRGRLSASKSWCDDTSRWCVPWRTGRAATWRSARTSPRRRSGRHGGERASLEQPGRLRSWLCGIARNLGKNARRRASRPAESASTPRWTSPGSCPATSAGPRRKRRSREEEIPRLADARRDSRVVSRAPDPLLPRGPVGGRGRRCARTQRRRRQATALPREGDAPGAGGRIGRGRAAAQPARTRVHRGRHRRPGHNLGRREDRTGGRAGVGPSGARAWKVAAGVGLRAACSGLWALVGLLGGWLGTWIPAQAAPTRGERDAILRAGRRHAAGLRRLHGRPVRADLRVRRRPSYLISWGVWFVAFPAYVAIESVRLARGVKRIRAKPEPHDVDRTTRRCASAGPRWPAGFGRPGLPQRGDTPGAPTDRHQPQRPDTAGKGKPGGSSA